MLKRITTIGILCIAAIAIAGCNSSELSLAPIPGVTPTNGAPGDTAAFPTTPDQTLAPASPASPSSPAAPGSAAPAVASLPAGQVRGRIRFMPVIGAPVNAVTPLSRQLAAEARNLGLVILSAADSSGDHALKGYFSADNFDGQTTVFYVWDVLDSAGARQNRIQGQESFTGSAGDPWASVPADVMARIATRTMAEYAAWRGL
ncbi:hypothetical protein [Hoeflea sp.]|uniref:hypothetical protein n=1 Tax=Hoeflea sp. TaxID=1940281 RepID=UPI002AFECBEA|nr:hypothetical protein [Hoeflea sp.]